MDCIHDRLQGKGRTNYKLHMNQLSLRNDQVKFKTSGELSILYDNINAIWYFAFGMLMFWNYQACSVECESNQFDLERLEI